MEVSVGKVTSKGQVTIPKEIRETLGVNEGDKLIFLVEGDKVVLRKVGSEKLSDILSRRRPWGERGLEFQRRLREEWRSG
ncbi:MAG: AbrB/MazE/SpoVT family DNA-binding domain-containing protein [Candidatus Bathyarchaeota archaeon]|nr:AbrB/MazE/SpoVT family DNA-binding domain-containing protein [Candidatus Bathyarchaeota archaeon]